MPTRTAAVLGAIVGLIAAAVVGGLVLRPAKTVPASAPVSGHLAPAFALSDTSGHKVTLDEYRGHVVLLNFFATWCVPCASEMPAIQRVYHSAGQRLTVLGVDKQEPAGDVRAFARQHGITFTLLLDPNLTVYSAYRVSVQPESFWIDSTGVIRAIHYGPMDVAYIQHEMARLE